MTISAVGILGVGRLGEPIAHAMLALPGLESLWVTARSAERVARLRETDSRVRSCDPEEILQQCDYLVVALGPDSARKLLATLAFEPRHHVVSIMAEITLAELRELTQGAASASRVLALPSVAQGGAPLPVYPASDAVEKLFGRRNSLIVAESELELLTFWSITGLLSSVLTVGRTAALWLEGSGISKHRAEAYARILFSEVHGLTASGFDEGLEHVSTPGGLNVMMCERIQRAGLEQQLSDGLDDIKQRLLKNVDNSNAAASPGAKLSSPKAGGPD